METIYTQLYSDYICPAMSQTAQEHKEIIDRFLHIVSLENDKKISAYDLITYIRWQWGLEAFTHGIRLGMELSSTPDRDPEDYQILLNFLTKLDQPVP